MNVRPADSTGLIEKQHAEIRELSEDMEGLDPLSPEYRECERKKAEKIRGLGFLTWMAGNGPIVTAPLRKETRP